MTVERSKHHFLIAIVFITEILEVGKNLFAASSVKKMSRFQGVSPEEIKRIVDNATPINTKRSTKYGLKVFTGKCVLNAIKYLDTIFAIFAQ